MVELIDRLIASDLSDLTLPRWRVLIGRTKIGADVHLGPHDGNILVAGPSGSGKTSITTALLERLSAAGRQFCAIDPEGDYDRLSRAIALRGGIGERLPTMR